MRDDDAETHETEESHGEFRTSFWIVLLAHLGTLALLWAGTRWWEKNHTKEQITWLDGGGDLGAPAAPAPPEAVENTAPPEPPPVPEPPTPEPEAKLPELPSDLALKQATPTPTPKPTPPPTPKPTPKPAPPAPTPKKEIKTTPKPAPQPTPPHVKKYPPKKPTTPKPAIATNDSATKVANDAKKAAFIKAGANASGEADTATNPGTKGGAGAAGSTLTQTQLETYFASVGARFKEVWEQPLTVEKSGKDLTATVRIRVGPDGVVQSATLVRSTGNREVDASIEAAIPKFRKVPSPPAALLKNGVMDEQMAVILDL